MKQKRNGFTMIEITLFIAITALLFVGIIAGTNNSIAQQRFTDSVQNFAEFLRSVYSEVSNPQSVGDGRSDLAIYGKLISFGQKYGLDGKQLEDQLEQRIFVYDVVGKVNAEGGELKEILKDLGVNVAVVTKVVDGKVEEMGPAGEVKSYLPRWGASIETTSMNFSGRKNVFKGSILVVRHPVSGTINTLISNSTIKVNETLSTANNDTKDFKPVEELLINEIDNFTVKEMDFCINPRGVGVENDNRRDIRLAKNARNASAVEIIDLDLDRVVNKNGSDVQVGNKCRFN